VDNVFDLTKTSKITKFFFLDLREPRCRASAAAALGHTMLMDALALAVKFIPFETYLLETSTHTNIAVTCRAGLIINAGIYQCVCVHIRVCMRASARVNTVFMFWGRERPLLYIMYGHRVYFAPHIQG
jgi:hypothetical protein